MKIGIVAPSSVTNSAMMAPALAFAALEYPDVELVFHPQCWKQDGHFAGTDDERAAAFLEFTNDPGFDAIWFARGGYGSNRLLTRIMPNLGPAANHKTFMGFSDTGFLLGALYARRIGRPTHGPMPGEILSKGGDVAVARGLAWLARGDRSVLEPGLDGRPSVALNLSILGALIGTPYLPDLTDHVLIIEDVSEPMYNIDRLLFHMAHATQLKGIAGVRLGSVTAVKPNEPAWGETIETMMPRWCAEMGVPYLGRAVVGHDLANRVVPFGVA